MDRVLGLALVALLSACSAPAPEPVAAPGVEATPVIAPAPVAVVVDTVVPTVAWVAEGVAEAVPLPDPPVKPPQKLISAAAVDLLVRTEVGSPALYQRKYIRPVWPGGASGVTIGIGADLGQMSRDEIRYDWAAHPQVVELEPAAGVGGQRARALTAAMQHVRTEYPLAYEVFEQHDVLQYYRIAARAYPGLDRLTLNAQGALVSLVFNRGGSMSCDPRSTRYEMCQIREQCLPLQSEVGPCVAQWLRTMKRVWRGKDIERGMNARREEEARLAETPDP